MPGGKPVLDYDTDSLLVFTILHLYKGFGQQLMMIHTLLSQFLIAMMLSTSPEAVLRMFTMCFMMCYAALHHTALHCTDTT